MNIGHWNYGQHSYQEENGRILLEDGNPLICYHFSGFRILSKDDMQQIHEKEEMTCHFSKKPIGKCCVM